MAMQTYSHHAVAGMPVEGETVFDKVNELFAAFVRVTRPLTRTAEPFHHEDKAQMSLKDPTLMNLPLMGGLRSY